MPRRESKQKPGEIKDVTQKDVADRAGVSPSIVSYVINNGPRSISEPTRQRVQRAIEELNYHPNVHAQKLMHDSSDEELAPGQFGVVIGGSREILTRPYYPSILHSIIDEGVRHALNMHFLLFYTELNDPLIFNKLIHPEEISALVLVDAGPKLLTDEGLARVERIRERIPNLISVGRQLPNIPTVTFDLGKAIYQATHHLLSLGHRRVAFMGTEETRLAGFEQALADHNLELGPNMIWPLAPYNTPDNGYKATQAMLENGCLHGSARITGIVAGSDEVALGVNRRLHEAGLGVPQDVSIIGINDSTLAQHLTPSLSTIRLPRDQMGRIAIQMLLQRKAHTSDPITTIWLPTELIIRESTMAIK